MNDEEALKTSDEWIKKLYLEKMQEVWDQIYNSPIESNHLIPLSKSSEDILYSLFEETILTLGGLQHFIREEHAYPYDYFSTLTFVLELLEYAIKGKMRLGI